MVYYVHSITKYGLTWHSVAQRIGKPTTRMPRPAEKVSLHGAQGGQRLHEKGVRLAQKIQVGPCIHVGIQL